MPSAPRPPAPAPPSAFAREVEAALARTGLDATRLGQELMGDPNFVHDVRQGRTPRKPTQERFRAALSAVEARTILSNPSHLPHAGFSPGRGLFRSEFMPEGLRTRVEDALEAFKAGQIVVVTDDDDRENEGDLFVAAVHCTPAKMAFIVRHTSGIVCAPLPRALAARLRLDPMVTSNDAPLGTAFTVSVDVRHGLTTGISAEERTNTIRALANPNVGAADFVRPGHVFPLIARDGGVLIRTGHTEACVDMCVLTDLPPVGVLAELMNDDGTVMRGPEVSAFADQHQLKRISVADLITYRQARESLVHRTGEFRLDLPEGQFQAIAYRTPFDAVEHLAIVSGRIGDGRNVLARLHRANLVEDVLTGGTRMRSALNRIANQKDHPGVLIYLRDGAAGVPVNAVGNPNADAESHSSGSEQARAQQWREVGVGAQILRDLGVHSIRVLTSSPTRFVGLSGFGIEIEEVVPFER